MRCKSVYFSTENINLVRCTGKRNVGNITQSYYVVKYLLEGSGRNGHLSGMVVNDLEWWGGVNNTTLCNAGGQGEYVVLP